MKETLEQFLANLESSLQLQYAVECCRPWQDNEIVNTMIDQLLSMAAIYSHQGQQVMMENEEMFESEEVCDTIAHRIGWLSDRFDDMVLPAEFQHTMESGYDSFQDRIFSSFSESYDYHSALLDGLDFALDLVDGLPTLYTTTFGTDTLNGPYIVFGLDTKIQSIQYYKDGEVILAIEFTDDNPHTLVQGDGCESPKLLNWGTLLAGTLGTAVLTQVFKQSRSIEHDQKA